MRTLLVSQLRLDQLNSYLSLRYTELVFRRVSMIKRIYALKTVLLD